MTQPPAVHEPMTEEQILAATIGERRVHGGPVHLVEGVRFEVRDPWEGP